MQNTVNNYIDNKVINIKSEILFREAEDEFFYFHNLSNAVCKLKKAINYTPFHLKSIILYADISFIRADFKKALSLYLIAASLKNNDFRITAAIANCYNALKKYNFALDYCNIALKINKIDNYSLYAQVIELKIDSLFGLKRYNDAYEEFFKSQEFLKQNLLNSVYNSLSDKIKRQQKLYHSGLKIV